MRTSLCCSAQHSPSGKQGVPEGSALSGEMAQQLLLQPPWPAGSAAPGVWSPPPSLWVHCASCQGGLQRRKPIMGLVLFFNSHFFQAQSLFSGCC